MTNVRKIFFALILTMASSMSVMNQASAATSADLDKDSQQALQKLYDTNPFAKKIAQSAKGILIFPNVVKAGLIFGAGYGEGELIKGKVVENYYNSITGSWGLQAGAQSYGYALFLMTDNAMKYVNDTHGWEIGVGPTVVIVDEGVAKNLSTSTAKDDVYGFVFDQQGLMAGVSLEGTKITKIRR
jgi:lipid-binding SYLF domain-containing protein